jgi:predicted ATP-dependent serine protease
MNYSVLQCRHCGTQNAVGACGKCGRYFVLTESHAQGQARAYESAPLGEFPSKIVELCDVCSVEAAGGSPAEIVDAGLRQQTCAGCHTEFLSQHGLGQKRGV